MNMEVIESVKHYQRSLERSSGDEQRMLHCISKLSRLPVTVQHLQDTGVGRTVNSLRKYDGDVGNAAKALVLKWKAMVAEAESSEEEEEDEGITSDHERAKTESPPPKPMSSYELKSNEADLRREDKSVEKSTSRNHSSRNDSPEVDSISKKHRHSSSSHKRHIEEDTRKGTEKRRKREASIEELECDDTVHDSHVEMENEESDASVNDSEVSNRLIEEHGEKLSEVEEMNGDTENQDSESSSEPVVQIKKKYHSSSHRERSDRKHSSHSSNSSHSSHRHNKSSPKTVKDVAKSEKSTDKANHKLEEKHEKNEKRNDRKRSSDHHSQDSRGKEREREKEKVKEKEKNREKEKLKEIEKIKEKEKYCEKEKNRDKEKIREKEKMREKEKVREKEKSKLREMEKSRHERDKKDEVRKMQLDKKEDTKNYVAKEESKSKTSSSSKSESKQKKVVKKREASSENTEEGIDSFSGTSFADALGMMGGIDNVSKKKKKHSGGGNSSSKKVEKAVENQPSSSSAVSTKPQVSSPIKAPVKIPSSPEELSLLDPGVKLQPLDNINLEVDVDSTLPAINPHYRPLPHLNLDAHSRARARSLTEEEALCQVMSTKNQRTKVYSGVKSNKSWASAPSLYDICVRVLQEHIDALEYTGGVPFDLLKPVLAHANPDQLFLLEHYNPYLIEDTDGLWQLHVQRRFRNKSRLDLETYREMYQRCVEESDAKLKALSMNIKNSMAKSLPVRQTKLAFVDSLVKPPRQIARKQAKFGTAHATPTTPMAKIQKLASPPAAAAAAATAGGNNSTITTVPAPRASHAGPKAKPRVAPLMMKTLKFAKSFKR